MKSEVVVVVVFLRFHHDNMLRYVQYLYRKSSAKQRYIHNPPSPSCEGPRISIEEVDIDEDGNQYDLSEPGENVSEDGYQSDSSSSEETDDEFISTRKLFTEGTFFAA